MSGLDAFFDRLDAVADEQDAVDHSDLVDDGRLLEHGRAMRDLFRRRADRASVDLDELVDVVVDRVDDTAQVTVARIERGAVEIDLDVDALRERMTDEIRSIAAAAGLQFFLAGVLWEQGRHLPEIDLDGGTLDG